MKNNYLNCHCCLASIWPLACMVCRNKRMTPKPQITKTKSPTGLAIGVA